MSDVPIRGLRRGLTDYGDANFSLYLRRSFAKSMGYSDDMLARPIVGICHTPSGFNNCHRQMPELLEAVKRGALEFEVGNDGSWFTIGEALLDGRRGLLAAELLEVGGDT